MRKIFGKLGFRGAAASMPIRNAAHSGTLPWAGVLAAMVTLVLLLGGCPQPDGGGGTSAYTVSFEANGGTPVPTAQTVNEGGKVTEPGAMTKAGHSFGGWYQEAAFTTPWNFATDTVTADITLYAKWTALPPGYKTTYTGDGISFKTAWVPGGVTFPTGTDDNGTPATVTAAYEIGETEVTYELWYAVKDWAESHGYTFYNDPGPNWGGVPGREGSDGTNGAVPTEAKQEPVTEVNWYDAVVWLNALTEWVNAKEGKSLEPVYYYDSGYTTVARDSNYTAHFVKEAAAAYDNYTSAYAKPGATGFRLPTSNEWELAARWRNDGTNTVSGYENPYFTQGDSASGATANRNDPTATGAVAWYSGNASSKTQPVKGKGANGLGIYDMSGNVFEWCDDWYPGYSGLYRILLGGSWDYNANSLRVGVVHGDFPGYRDDDFGFRPLRTAN